MLLAACGQKGPLFLPTDDAAAGRATLPQARSPSTAVTNPALRAPAPPATGKAAPVRHP